MKIKMINFDRIELIERKRLIDELLEIDTGDMEFNEKNLERAKEIVTKYNKATTDNWNNKQPKILVANSKDEIIATIR